ncbi:MAG: PadR family transcriptional regulator [Candidatus Heimdallarchaeota archaeon]|nr:PadR family transcriptional regulator [Candidatus Heimdallarchaeota archaeon]MCK4878662.1 PadR family transcriptional regulator [Candidatus Heimdallarchaeota archaeon]
MNSDKVIEKYEEKLARKLGEIAILIHLARSPEGSHAYEMRSKASDILFENRRKGIEFIHNHLKALHELRKLSAIANTDSEEYDNRKNSVAKEIESCPIFKHNPHIQNLVNRENEAAFSKDLDYISEVIGDLELTGHEIKKTTTIWSNISGIYPAIESLEKNGLIKYLRKDSDGDRIKKIYEITDIGRATLSKILVSLVDLTSFVFRVEEKHFMVQKGKKQSIILNPFGSVFRKLAEDIPPEMRKKIMHYRDKHHGKPFARMFMEHGLPLPSFRFLIRHPNLIKEHLNKIESEEERNLAKEFLKTKLTDRKVEIEKMLKELE